MKLSAVTCLSEENSRGRSVNTLFFKSTVFRDGILPIIGGTFRKSLLQILRDFGFPLVAFSKILSAILYPCQQCSRAHKLSFGGQPQALEDFLLQADSLVSSLVGFEKENRWYCGFYEAFSNMSGVSFVSETEIDEIRKKRQEEWEKVRKEDDPLGIVSLCLFTTPTFIPPAQDLDKYNNECNINVSTFIT